MAYATKYRATFKDHYNTSVQVDILQDGFSGSITTIKAESNGLNIEWPSDRGNIFDPIRGALASFSFYATTSGQFNEFFEASTNEYKLQVTYDSATYWTGYLMLGDYQEALLGAPYVVTVKANDLGFLKYYQWDVANVGRESLITTLFKILDILDITTSVVERVNIYEDSISDGVTNSIFDQISIQEVGFISDQWVGIDMYEVLKRIMIAFGCFIMQEDNHWNICRIPDMARDHNYRRFTRTTKMASGSEDSTALLSTYNKMNLSPLLITSQNYRKLNFFQNYGQGDLVNNGAVNLSINPNDYWTKSAAVTLGYSATRETGSTYKNIIVLLPVSSTRTTITHDKTYNVFSGTQLNVIYEAFFESGAGTGDAVRIEIKLVVGATTYYLNMATYAWTTTSTDSIISATAGAFYTDDFLSDATPGDGVLSIKLYEANFTTANGQTRYYLNIFPGLINGLTNFADNDLSETIDSNSFEETESVITYLGDPIDTDAADIQMGSLLVSSTGLGTDSWLPDAGGPAGALASLTRDYYKAQLITPARRLQATLMKSGAKYLDVIEASDGRKYLPSYVRRNFSESTLQGEWIEIKTGWTLLSATYSNGIAAANLYDTFSVVSNNIGIVKSQTATIAQATVSITTEVGRRYKLDVEIVNPTTSDIPDVTFCGVAKTDLVTGSNVWEIVATAEQLSSDEFLGSAISDEVDLSMTINIYEAYGL